MGHLYFCIYQKALSMQMLSPDPFHLKNNTVFLRAISIILYMCTSQKSLTDAFHHFSVEDLFKVCLKIA